VRACFKQEPEMNPTVGWTPPANGSSFDPMTMKLLLLNLVSLLFSLSLATAQEQTITPGSEDWKGLFDPPYEKPTELPADLPLRKELFDLLRPKVEKIAKEPTRFEGHLRVFKNWAMFMGRSIDANGESIQFPEMDNDDTVALWIHAQDGWKLITYSAGHSDAFYLIWPAQYGAPKELFQD
jgi:hypothetical protein